MSQINNIVKVQISKFLGYKLPPVPEDESIEDIDKYKIYDFDFTKGKLPDGVEFYRLSRDWDWDGNEYDIDQPVLYGEGLWNWGGRTNLIRFSEDLTKWMGSGVVNVVYDESNRYSAVKINNGGYLTYRDGVEFYKDYSASFKIKQQLEEKHYIRLNYHRATFGGDFRTYIYHNDDVEVPEGGAYEEVGGWISVAFKLNKIDVGDTSNSIVVYTNVKGIGGDYPPLNESTYFVKDVQLTACKYRTPTIPTHGSRVTVSKSLAQAGINLLKDFTLFGTATIKGNSEESGYVFSIGREVYPERYIGLKLNRLTNKLQLDSSVGVSKESVKTYKAGDVIKFAVVRCRDRFGVVINGEEFLEINFKVNFLNSDLNKLFFGNYFDSDEHILPSYIKHFAIYDKPFNTNTLIHMTEVEDGDS